MNEQRAWGNDESRKKGHFFFVPLISSKREIRNKFDWRTLNFIMFRDRSGFSERGARPARCTLILNGGIMYTRSSSLCFFFSYKYFPFHLICTLSCLIFLSYNTSNKEFILFAPFVASVIVSFYYVLNSVLARFCSFSRLKGTMFSCA